MDLDEHADAVFVGVAVLPFDRMFGVRQQRASRESRARRRGVGKQKRVEIVDGVGPRQLPQGKIALLVRAATLRLRAASFGDGADQAGDQHGEQQDGKRHRSAMAAHKLGRAIGERVGAGQDGFVAEMAREVHREPIGGRIAALPVLLQAFHHDPVEIAAEPVDELPRIEAPALRGGREFLEAQRREAVRRT